MAWYENAVIYQIYPRSFQDSNSDGIGDLRGIVRRLPYIKSLGVDAIWLSPIYRSPMKDFGYDVSDYRQIDPIFGSMEDFDVLVNEAHKLGLRVMMDMVLNHSSDLHEWFQKSRAKEDPYTDFYIWRDSVPNNWKACFGGSAWTYDEKRGQYYLHSFLKEQPDLNWHDEVCRNAIFDEVRFYLDKGVDGFRLDVINAVGKDPELKSNPFMFGETPRPYDMQNHIYDRNTSYTHEYIRLLRNVIEQYDDRALLGEIMVQGKGQMEQSASYTGKNNDELQLCFDFSLCKRPLTAKNLRKVAKRWYELNPLDKGKTPCWVLSNHDVPRAITRAGNRDYMGRLLAVYLLMQRGCSVVYFGEELGMQSKDFPRKEIQDPLGKQYWPIMKGRDAERRPMQWDFSANMGFTDAKPWLEPNYTRDWRHLTVESQEIDRDTMLALYRNLIALRKSREEISRSDAFFPAGLASSVLAYSFSKDGRCTAVVLNMGTKTQRIKTDTLAPGVSDLTVALSTYNRVNVYVKDGILTLPAGLGVVLTN